MSFYDKIVQVISNHCGEYYDGCGGESPSVITYDTPEALVLALQGELTSHEVVKTLLANNSFRAALERQGWCDLEQATKVAEKATLGTEFFLWETKESYSSPRKIDFDKLTKYAADHLAKDGTVLLCTITKGSLHKLNRKVHTAYLAAKKKVEEKKKAAKKGAETRAQKKREKKLAEAKKLLQEAGELDK